MYPIRYEADYDRERSRLTVFFRYFLAIPWQIVGFIYAIAAFVVVVIAWFALLFTARYPESLYNFASGYLRFSTRYNAWYSLQTDAWPPFGFADDPTYPVRISIASRERQSRLKVFFRGLLAFPLFFVAFGIAIIHWGATTTSWLTIVFRGYQPAGLHNALLFTNAWGARFAAYGFLFLTDAYPPVGDEAAQVGDVRASAPAAPSPEPPPATGEAPAS